jgi:hypothetical protein
MSWNVERLVIALIHQREAAREGSPRYDAVVLLEGQPL